MSKKKMLSGQCLDDLQSLSECGVKIAMAFLG